MKMSKQENPLIDGLLTTPKVSNSLKTKASKLKGLAADQCGWGSIHALLSHRRVEFVVGSRPYSERFFSGYSGFPLSSKTKTTKFHFNPESESHRIACRNRPLSLNRRKILITVITQLKKLPENNQTVKSVLRSLNKVDLFILLFFI